MSYALETSYWQCSGCSAVKQLGTKYAGSVQTVIPEKHAESGGYPSMDLSLLDKLDQRCRLGVLLLDFDCSADSRTAFHPESAHSVVSCFQQYGSHLRDFEAVPATCH